MTLERRVEDDNGLPAGCDICQRLLRALRVKFGDFHHDALGLLDPIFRQDCPFHVPLFRTLIADIGHPLPRDRKYTAQIVRQYPIAATSIVVQGKTDDLDDLYIRMRQYYLVSDSSIPATGDSLGRIPDTQFIDPKLPRRWMLKCMSEHADKCRNSTDINSGFGAVPSWLIDVRRRCLVPGSLALQYACLSYVWGGHG